MVRRGLQSLRRAILTTSTLGSHTRDFSFYWIASCSNPGSIMNSQPKLQHGMTTGCQFSHVGTYFIRVPSERVMLDQP
jgi:hypothetical protein